MSFIELCLAIIAWRLLFPGDPYKDNYEAEADYLKRMENKKSFWTW